MTVAPVQVCVRVRPVTAQEALKKDNNICVDILKQSNTIRIKNSKDKQSQKEFTFDCVYGYEQSQSHVYETMVRALIQRCLEGYNGCIFAYGQTASGKTYTIQGPSQPMEDQYGVIQRVALQIIQHVDENKKKDIEFSMKITYLEIYNESLVDLLAGEDSQSDLKIRQEQDGGGLYVQGLTERGVSNFKEIMSVHQAGAKNRTVGMNEASSRSHAIMTITVTERRKDQKTDKIVKKSSKIHIVDLAGSERAESTGATGQRLKEGAAINQSLSCLGNVINALTKTGERGHIPYRDSKLTYLLSDSLGGNSLTLMIACLSPTLNNFDESVSTLRFAERVKTIKNHAKINMDPLMLRILELEAELEEMRARAKQCTCGAMSDDQTTGCSNIGRSSKNVWRSIKSSFGRKRVKPIDEDVTPDAIDKDVKDDKSEKVVKDTKIGKEGKEVPKVKQPAIKATKEI